MKARVLLVVSLMSLALTGFQSQAQLDSSSAVLLKSHGKGPNAKNLDSSRYKMRAPESKREDEVEEQPGTYIPSPVPKVVKEKPTAKVSEKSEPVAPTALAPVPVIAPPANPPSVPQVIESPSVTVQVRELIMGGSEEDIDEVKRQIHPEDPRANILSISLAPAYFYDGSNSNYSFRNYHSDGPGIGLGMNLWLTPFFGVQSKYFSSVSSGVRDGVNMVPMITTQFEAGVRFRRHFGYTRRSAQLSWGIDYHDEANKISTDAVGMIGRKSSGLSFSLEGVVPTSVTHAHLFDLSIRPSQHHSEMDTSSSARSGTKNQSNAISLAVGGQWTLDRRNQIFWKGQYSVERNLFDGTASKVDPKTGVAPTGVSVTNSLVIFYFGFKWGS